MLGRAPGKNVILHPGNFIVVKLDKTFPDGTTVLLEPRVDTKTFQRYNWLSPVITKVIANEIHIPNSSKDIVTVRKSEHICQLRATKECEISLGSALSQETPVSPITTPPVTYKVQDISIDPNNQLSEEWRDKFAMLHEEKKECRSI